MILADLNTLLPERVCDLFEFEQGSDHVAISSIVLLLALEILQGFPKSPAQTPKRMPAKGHMG